MPRRDGSQQYLELVSLSQASDDLYISHGIPRSLFGRSGPSGVPRRYGAKFGQRGVPEGPLKTVPMVHTPQHAIIETYHKRRQS